MRRDLSKPDVPWSFRVASSDIEALAALLPMTGARTWLIERGFIAFCELAEASADILEWAHQDVQRMLGEYARERDVSELNVRVPTDIYVRFSKLLPEFGGATWFVRKYIRALVADLQSDGVGLEERVALVINRVMQPEGVEG